MSKKPNIVFIMSDDQGPWALNYAGTTDLHTLNIDKLAEKGIYFENFFCASPVCSPARASILTGNIPSSHGVQDWIRSGNLNMDDHPELKSNPTYASETDAIDYLKGQTTYPKILSENGYNCALSGKWHLGNSIEPQQGFSKWFTIARGGSSYYNADVVLNGEVYFEERYLTDVITDKAIEFVDHFSKESDPFYLSVHYTAPHDPWDAANHPDEYLDMYQDHDFNQLPDLPIHPQQVTAASHGTGERRKELLRGYYASITAMDTNIGRLINHLEEKDMIDNTLIVFTSDNGMNMGHHGIWGKGNGTIPQNMFDTSVKVPFIISYPKEMPESVKTDHLVSQYDFFPTLFDYLEIDFPSGGKLPGKSFAPILRNESMTEEGNIFIFDEYGPVRMIRNKEWKYIHRYPYGPHEFYHLEEDPDENHNLYDQEVYQERIEKMKAEMEKWFYKYVNPKTDAIKEANLGHGQLRKPGIYSEGKNAFSKN